MIHLGGRGPRNCGRRSRLHWWRPGAFFDADFKGNRYYGPALGISRASAAYLYNSAGNWTQVPANTLRRTDLGLLVEPAATNLFTYSEQFQSWSLGGAPIITPDVASAPNGISSADKFASEVGGVDYLYAAASFTAGTAYSFSIFAKPAGVSSVATLFYSDLWGSGASRFVTFDLAAKTATIVGASNSGEVSAAVLDVGGGWVRCVATILPTVTVTSSPQWVRSTANGDGTSGLYLWGAQLEAGAAPTSYVPTTTATAARSADQVTVLGTGIGRFVYQLDDGSTQTVAQNPAAQHVIPTNLNRRYIARMTGYAS